jgi:hypothetical protein
MLLGRSVDRACGYYFGEKIKDQNHLPVTILHDVIHETFEAGKEDVDWKKEEDGDCNTQESKAIACIGAYHEKTLLHLQPVEEPQKRFRVPVTGSDFDLLGVIDITAIDERDSRRELVIDQKTSKSKWAEHRVKTDPQLTMYSLSRLYEKGEIEVHGRYDIMVKTKKPYVDECYTIRKLAEMQAMVKTAASVFEAIQKEVFPPALPTDYMCSEKYCDYWAVCKFRGGAD